MMKANPNVDLSALRDDLSSRLGRDDLLVTGSMEPDDDDDAMTLTVQDADGNLIDVAESDLRDAVERAPEQARSRREELRERARSGSMTPAEMREALATLL